MMPRATARLLPLPLLLAACASGAGGGAATAPPRADRPAVRLLHAGSGPARLLRLEPEAGARQELVLLVDMGGHVRTGERAHAVVLPPWRIGLSTSVLSVSGGRARTRTVVEEARLAPRAAIDAERMRALEDSVRRLVGLSWESSLAPDGFQDGGGFALPAGTDEAFRQLGEITGAAVLLPAEPVARGARWEFTHSQSVDGLPIEQTTVAELVSLDGPRAEIAFQVRHRAPAGARISRAGAPGMVLESMAGEGRGRVVLDLRRPMPELLELESSVRWEVRQDGGTERASAHVTMLARMRPPGQEAASSGE